MFALERHPFWRFVRASPGFVQGSGHGSGHLILRPKRNAASRGLEHADGEAEPARVGSKISPGPAALEFEPALLRWCVGVTLAGLTLGRLRQGKPRHRGRSITPRTPSATTTRRWTAFDSQEPWRESTRQKMSEVKRKYGYSRYARLAELRLADADFQQEKYAEATAGYKSFVHDYPNDPQIPYARYQVTRTQYDAVSATSTLPYPRSKNAIWPRSTTRTPASARS